MAKVCCTWPCCLPFNKFCSVLNGANGCCFWPGKKLQFRILIFKTSWQVFFKVFFRLVIAIQLRKLMSLYCNGHESGNCSRREGFRFWTSLLCSVSHFSCERQGSIFSSSPAMSQIAKRVKSLAAKPVPVICLQNPRRILKCWFINSWTWIYV